MSMPTYQGRVPTHIVVLAALRRLSDPEGYVVISNKKLRDYAGIGAGSVFRAIKRLRTDGHIAWVAGGGPYPAQIRLLAPGDDVAAVTAELARRAAAARAKPIESRAARGFSATGRTARPDKPAPPG